jgi:phospholipase/carboxylesterase
MRTPLVPLCVFLLAVTGCVGWGPSGDREHPRYATASQPMAGVAAQPMAGPSAPPDEWQGAPQGNMGAPQAVAAPYGEAQAAGIPYVELVTGGARSDETLPMIVAMHPHGGSVQGFVRMFQSFPARARIIIPHGHATGNGRFNWWEPRVAHDDPQVVSAAVRPIEQQMALALRQLVAQRPTLGRPVVCGFSQGGMLSYALVVNHPELVSAAYPFGAFLPAGFSPGALTTPGPRPYVHAFQGAQDPVVTINMARGSIAELRRLGLRAEITEYPTVGHRLDPDEVRAALNEMAALVSRPGGTQ